MPNRPRNAAYRVGCERHHEQIGHGFRDRAPTGWLVVKETELWQRLQDHLGAGYYRVWASEFSLADLDQRTVVEALDDGVPSKVIWRAVWAALELPPRER